VLGRKSFRQWGEVVIVAFLLLAITFDAQATSVIAPRFETLVDRAELIFAGQVTGQRSEWKNHNGQRSIVTLVTFAVRQVHKGHAESAITLQFLGGTVGDVTLEVADIPKFRPGERVVLFIEDNGLAASPVIGFFHGKFSLRQDESGRESVFTHNNDPLTDVAELGRAKRLPVSQESRRALSHEEFSAAIGKRLSVRERK
jgi:hypothetical protein